MNHLQSRNRGQALLIGILFMGIFVTISVAVMGYVTLAARSERLVINSSQALHLAEAGLDKAVYELNQGGQAGSYAGEADTALGDGTFSVAVTTIDSNSRLITATGYVPNSATPRATKTIKAKVAISGNIVSFHYGVQTGNGGIQMNGAGTTINGSVYSNGNIVAENITGSAVAADPPATYADQSNELPIPPFTDLTFGNANATEDFAQSFQVSDSFPINSVQFYIKKVGTPANETVKIHYDNSGVPGTQVSGMSGTLSAAAVTTNYGWVTVSLPATFIPTVGETYWLVIDGASNAAKYYLIGANSNGYASGASKIGKSGGTWNNPLPVDLDGYFRIFLGGGHSSISGGNIGTTVSDVGWAHSVTGATISGPLYCQSGSGNNKACDTSRADPTPQDLPLSDGNIQDWKDEAEAGGVINGNYNPGSDVSLGPKKIIGNLTLNGGRVLTVTGTLWVTGNITLSGGGEIHLDASYGTHDGVILNDGTVSLGGGSNFQGSGEPGSYPFLITTSSCPDGPSCGGSPAITFSGGSGTVALVAQNGTINISGGSNLKAVTAKTLSMGGGATLIYDSGLVNANFTSGPGGSWTFTPGSYQIAQ